MDNKTGTILSNKEIEIIVSSKDKKNDLILSSDKEDKDVKSSSLNKEETTSLSSNGTNAEMVSNTFKRKIIAKYMRPNFELDLENILEWKSKWSKIAGYFNFTAELLGVVQTVISATNSAFNIYWLSYFAVLFGLLAVGFSRLGAYAKQKKISIRNEEYTLLSSIGIKGSLKKPIDIDDSNINESTILDIK
jgi:hypothetical protein